MFTQLKEWLPALITAASIVAGFAVAQSRLTELEAKHSVAAGEISKLRENQHELDKKTQRTEVVQENMLDLLQEIKSDIKDLKKGQ